MTRRKMRNRNTRKLTRIGDSSLGVTLPVEFLKALKWREKQKVVVIKRGKTITIKDWPVKKKKPKGRVGKK